MDAILDGAPDLVMLDVHMPDVDGYEVLSKVHKRARGASYIPILLFTSDTSQEARQQALDLGANDFITKPFERTEILLRVRNFLRMRAMHLSVQEANVDLERRVRARTEELTKARSEARECLARAMEYRDDSTGGHNKRVGAMSARIAEALGLNEETVETIRITSPLHDLGKIGISDDILLKPGLFTDEESYEMQRHTLLGDTIIGDCSSPVLKEVREIALHHHERWDGSGYPHGLKGAEIPITCRIVAIADFYDALTHVRPYKRAWTHDEAVAETRAQSGRHFDPAVVDVFLRLYA